MLLAAHQPQYLPGLRFFAKMRESDLFVLLDDVQYERREYQNRNRIRAPSGSRYLTVPVLSKGRFGGRICEMPLDNSRPWAADHLQAIRLNYARAAHCGDYLPALEKIYSARYEKLSELALATVYFFRGCFGIKTPVRFSSEFALASSSTARLADICRAAGAGEYLSGAGARSYLDAELFNKAGISVRWQEFRVKPYPQAFPGFVPDLSALDLLLNCGPDSPGYF